VFDLIGMIDKITSLISSETMVKVLVKVTLIFIAEAT